MDNPINCYINKFLNHFEQKKHASVLTVQNYKFYLRRFILLTQIKEPTDINLDTVEKFRYLLSQVRNKRSELMKLTTQNYHLIALRAFLNFIQSQGLITLDPNKVALNKIGQRNINSLEKSNIETLLQAPLQVKNPGIIQKRDKALLELLFSTGFKVSELAALKKSQINFLHDSLTIKGMGGRLRTVELNNHAKYWLKEYLEARTDNLPALFIRHDKARSKQLKKISADKYQLTPRTIQRIIKKYAKSANLDPDITPQTLRHSYAKYLLEQGEDLKTVQSKLGHASIITTHIYKHI